MTKGPLKDCDTLDITQGGHTEDVPDGCHDNLIRYVDILSMQAGKKELEIVASNLFSQKEEWTCLNKTGSH